MHPILPFPAGSVRTEVRLARGARQSGAPGEPSAAGLDLLWRRRDSDRRRIGPIWETGMDSFGGSGYPLVFE